MVRWAGQVYRCDIVLPRCITQGYGYGAVVMYSGCVVSVYSGDGGVVRWARVGQVYRCDGTAVMVYLTGVCELPEGVLCLCGVSRVMVLVVWWCCGSGGGQWSGTVHWAAVAASGQPRGDAHLRPVTIHSSLAP